MNNLYVFAIGGSGERVMRSLIMLLAAGVKIGAKSITPIFVDNDANSAALTRCKNLLNYYNANAQTGVKDGIGTLCQKLNEDKRPSFFQTKIENPIYLDLSGSEIGDLKTIIGNLSGEKSEIEKNIIEERDLLFSQDDLEMNLTVGFVGNPNIGSVVLKALSFSNANFTTILQNASANDGVIVVGSLFGGTGAAGFPLIINSFMQSVEASNRPAVGGVAMLPYFDFGSEDKYEKNEKIIDTNRWDVNSDSFSSKTRAALMYYDDYMKNMDYLYYVGDDMRSMYDHYVGGPKQDNPVHLVEFLGAVSVIDFSKGTKQQIIQYKLPILDVFADGTTNHPTVCNVASIKNQDVKKALVKFQLLREYFINVKDGFLYHAIDNNQATTKDIAFDDTMRQACVGKEVKTIYKDVVNLNTTVNSETQNFQYAWGLNAFFKEWIAWWDDLNGNNAKRKFSIFPNGSDAADINSKNITTKFYNNSDYGVAKTKTKTSIFSAPKTEPIEPKIANEVLAAHKKLKWASIPEDKKLVVLLKTISDGLDNVIENACDL